TLGFTDPDGDILAYEVTDGPANGAVTIDAVIGTYTYTPATRPEFGEPDGTATFTIVASDPEGLTASTDFDVPVAALPDPGNNAPVAGAPGTPSVNPETGVVTGALGFTDPDGDTLTYTVTDPPANGAVTINAVADTYTYTPASRPEFGEPDGTASFTVLASDGELTASTTFDVPVAALPAPDNQAPQAGQSGPWQINEETGVVTATLGFTDPDGDPLTYEVTDQPANGIVTVDNDAGTYTYTPATRPEFGEPDGTTSFTVVATDPGGLTATNTIGLPIVALPAPANNAPVAGTPGTPTVDPETGVVTGTLGFTDPDDDTLTYTVTDPPANGEVTINTAAGTYTYTPATRPEAGEPDGTAGFTVVATDPGGLTASTTFTVPVTAEPGEPVEATLIDTIDVGGLPLGAAITGDGAYVYVTSALGDSITVIDTATGTVETTIPVSNSTGVVITPDGTRAYVTASGGVVSVVDTASNTVTTTVSLNDASGGIAVSPDGTQVYVSRGDGVISVIDTATNTESGSFGLNQVPENDIVFSPDGTRAYVADVLGVSVIDTSTTEVVTLIEAGSNSIGLAINGDGSRIYVTDLSDNTVNVIDTTSNAVIATIPVGTSPDPVAISPDGSRVYVPSGADGTISVIDTASNTVVATVTAGEEGIVGAYAVVISPDGERMYVTNLVDGTLMVFALGSVTV
ncbi:MAG: hypothetical protein U1D00_23675, partial [Mycobacterium sp.]|nr:hypothetical protein [Mycobacterium sp.]